MRNAGGNPETTATHAKHGGNPKTAAGVPRKSLLRWHPNLLFVVCLPGDTVCVYLKASQVCIK